MAQVYKLDGVTLTNRVRLNNDQAQGVIGLPEAAWYGEVRSAAIVIDDPLGELDLDLNSIRTFTMDETASTGTERQFTGWLVAKRISRGPYTSGEGCQYECEIYDQNWIFHFQVARASSAVRPAETDVERVQWLITSALMSGTPIADNGRFSTASPANLPGNNFVPEYPIAILEPTAGNSGKQFYAYWDDSADEISMHYDLVNDGPTCSLAISNVESDLDSTTFWPFHDAALDADAREQVNGMLFGYLGGRWVYAEDPDLFGPNEFSPVNFRRDEVYRTDAVGLTSTAETLADRYLASRAVEVDTIECAIRVPASQIGLIHAGMLITVKFSHLRSYKTETEVYIKYCNKVPSPGRRDMYEVHLTLTNKSEIFPSGGDGSETPYQPVCNPEFVQGAYDTDSSGNAEITLGATPTVDNVLVAFVMEHGGPGKTMTGFTQIESYVGYPDVVGTDNCSLWYRVVQSGDGAHYQITGAGSARTHLYVAEFGGMDTLVDSDTEDVNTTFTGAFLFPAGTVTVSGPSSLLVGIGGCGPDTDPGQSIDPVDATELFDTLASVPTWSGGYRVVGPGTWTFEFEGFDPVIGSPQEGYCGIVAAFGCTSSETPPPAGIHVIQEVVAMVGDTGTTRFPFAPGSLLVYVDNTDQTGAVIDQDPDAGTFQLAFTPTPTERVTVSYQTSVATGL